MSNTGQKLNLSPNVIESNTPIEMAIYCGIILSTDDFLRRMAYRHFDKEHDYRSLPLDQLLTRYAGSLFDYLSSNQRDRYMAIRTEQEWNDMIESTPRRFLFDWLLDDGDVAFSIINSGNAVFMGHYDITLNQGNNLISIEQFIDNTIRETSKTLQSWGFDDLHPTVYCGTKWMDDSTTSEDVQSRQRLL